MYRNFEFTIDDKVEDEGGFKTINYHDRNFDLDKDFIEGKTKIRIEKLNSKSISNSSR